MSVLHPIFKQKLLAASIGDLTSVTLKASLGRVSAYTYTGDTADDFKNEVTTVQDGDNALASPTISTPTPGVFDAADLTFTAVPAGAALNFLVIWKDTGTASTSPMLAYFDGFSITPNGGSITVVWAQDSIRIFQL